jgi:hypothetical protein
MAAPAIAIQLPDVRHQSRPQGIQMDIADEFLEEGSSWHKIDL